MDDATEHRSILLGSPPKRRRADEGDAGSPGGRGLRAPDVPPPELMPQLALAAAGASAEGAADLPPGLPQAEDVLGDPSLVAGGSAVPDAAAGGTETEMWEEGRHPARDARPAPIPEAVAARGPPVLPGLGPIVKDRNGRTPFGRIRSCMCAAPHVCRDIAWRWARLRRGRYINFLLVPGRSAKSTPTAAHVNAYRSCVFRGLGFGDDCGDGGRVERTIMNRSRTRGETVVGRLREERLSVLHYHPDVIPYVVESMEGRAVAKTEKWRVPLDVGGRVGYGEEDLCPAADSQGRETYFAVPNYPLERALADVEAAEARWSAAPPPRGPASRGADDDAVDAQGSVDEDVEGRIRLQADVEGLGSEVARLRYRAASDAGTIRDLTSKNRRLAAALRKMGRRLDKVDPSSRPGGTDGDTAAMAWYRSATGEELYDGAELRRLGEEGRRAAEREGRRGRAPNDGAAAGPSPRKPPAGPPAAGGGKRKDAVGPKPKADGTKKKSGGFRWSDPRMDRAVEARLADPGLDALEALRAGGYAFPDPGEGTPGITQKDIRVSCRTGMVGCRKTLPIGTAHSHVWFVICRNPFD